jgi:NAD(P)-dependent dehydrogenase (short-subunit alcohol dehydrogenase family)
VSSPVTLVTGSARGIGLGVAREFLGREHRVHVVWRSSGEQAAELESQFPGRVHRADLGTSEAAAELVRAVLEQDGRLDNVVHAVGEYKAGALVDTTPEHLRQLLISNVDSAFTMATASREALRAARGSLILFGCSGVESLRARRESAAYTAAKTALLSLMRSLALEEASHGVRVNMVSPGLVPHEHASGDTHEYAADGAVPLGRAGSVQDLARAVAWLCSQDAEHVTGQNLDVAGGWML